MIRQEELYDEISELKDEILRDGYIGITDTDMHYKADLWSVEFINQLEEYYDLCSECVCDESIREILMERGIDLEYTQYHEYQATIVIEYDEEEMRKACPDEICSH